MRTDKQCAGLSRVQEHCLTIKTFCVHVLYTVYAHTHTHRVIYDMFFINLAV